MKSSWQLHWTLLILLTGLAALSPGIARASEVFHPAPGDPLLEPWRWRSFPDLNGLGVQCIGEGKGGTMWFGTTDGAWSYDGLQWTFYGRTNGLPGGVDILYNGPGSYIYGSGA